MSNRYALLGVLGGIVLGAVALVIAWAYAGAGHGTYIPAKVLFPYTMYLAVAVVGRITVPLLLLALLEFPAYGLAAGLAARRGRVGTVLVSILVLHVVMTAVCLHVKNADFARLPN
jgi:hypothetical protein